MLIQATIRQEFSSCTVLIIAHRINTILDWCVVIKFPRYLLVQNSDRVLVLDAGKVAEFSSPTSLLRNSKSIFYQLCRTAGIVD
jgi:ABC-type multidrug transport system fused ATPase/permease subunit